MGCAQPVWCDALDVRRVTTVRVVWTAPRWSWASSVARTRIVRACLRSARALLERRNVIACTLPPATVNVPVVSVRIAAFLLTAFAPAITAPSVRSVTVPAQLVSVAGQLIFTVTVPDRLTWSEVPVSSASGTGGTKLI